MAWWRHIPKPVRTRLAGIAGRLAPSAVKQSAELRYWEQQWEAEGHAFRRDHYKDRMLGMAGEPDAGFLAGKIVADFGCGPRGSLWWADTARIRIGIDVLADAYARFGIAQHDTCYVCSSEQHIPLPTGYVDVLYTMNALDHVRNLPRICRELLRILVPGGLLIGSFNLDEPPTVEEPQRLTEHVLQKTLLQSLEVESYRVAAPGPRGDAYRHFFDDTPAPTSGHRYLWVRARRRP